MNPFHTPPTGAKMPEPTPTTPAPYETTWIGCETALPWIRIPLPLVRSAPRPRPR